MSELTNRITKAIVWYRAALDKFQEIEEALENFQTQHIERLTSEFSSSMDQAKEADRAVQSLPLQRPTDRENELQQVYMQLLDQLQRKIQAIGPRLQSLKAMQLAEMKQIKLGRQTASGYARHTGTKTGRIINSSN